MYLLIIGWMYVVLMMAVAEATNSNGTVLGAIVTFVLYGLLPSGLLAYLMGTPARNKRNKQQRAEAELAFAQQVAAATAEPTEPARPDETDSFSTADVSASSAPTSSSLQATQSTEPNTGSHPASGAVPVAVGSHTSVAPVRKES